MAHLLNSKVFIRINVSRSTKLDEVLPTNSLKKDINVKTKGILKEIVFFGDYIYKF